MEQVFETRSHFARELTAAELPALQTLFESNPEYFVTVSGKAVRPNEAQEEYDEKPPAHIPHGRRWLLGFFNEAGELQGMSIVVRDLGAPGVWHIALYFWATRLHGSGAPIEVHAALQAWATSSGAVWLRLGVVVGNRRAERFWEKLGYLEVRRRASIPAGDRTNETKVMVKPLLGQSPVEYLELVPRDQPGSSLP